MKRIFLATALALTATSAANADDFNAVQGLHLVYAYATICKPGSMTPEAAQMVEATIKGYPNDLVLRVRAGIAEGLKSLGPKFCPALELLETPKIIGTLNAEAKVTGGKPMSRPFTQGGRSITVMLAGEGNGRDTTYYGTWKQEPDWRQLSMRECAVAIDADLALRAMELNDSSMFTACDYLTKGRNALQFVGQPRRGTAKGNSVANCVSNYYARTPLREQRMSEMELAAVCQSPMNN